MYSAACQIGPGLLGSGSESLRDPLLLPIRCEYHSPVNIRDYSTSHWLRYDLCSLMFLYNQLCLKPSSPAIPVTPGFPASGNLQNGTQTPWLSCAGYRLETLGHASFRCFFSSPRVCSAQEGPKKHCGLNAHLTPGLKPKASAVYLYPARSHTTGCDQEC